MTEGAIALLRVLHARRISCVRASEILGVTPGALTHWTTGSTPRLEIALKIADEFGIEPRLWTVGRGRKRKCPGEGEP